MNLPTILICLALVAIVGAILWNMIRNKKKGKSNTCGCGCSNCAMSGMCHGAENKKES